MVETQQSIGAADKAILRDLAKQYLDVCNEPVQNERRDLWRRHNSLRRTRPLIYVRAFAWSEMPQAQCSCSDPQARAVEDFFRRHLFWHSAGDDSIFEPWVTVNAVYRSAGWGLAGTRMFGDEPGGSFKVDYPIKELSDVDKMLEPHHAVDDEQTARKVARLADAIGDIITINVDRAPAYRTWNGDLSTDLGYLRGIEHFMLDMMDNPQWLHRLVGLMSAGVRRTHDEAEAAGDWNLSAHQNQAMPYAEELADPVPNVNGVQRRQLWYFIAAQELTAVSPAMHEEFMLNYQLPIVEPFGLVAYGCCEDLTHKIDMLRRIPNLRRIAVSPFADVRACAEQINEDYVFSYRPSPADMVSYGLDAERITAILRRDLAACKHCHVDITLKDVETVQRDPTRVREWVRLTRRVIDEVYAAGD